MREAVSCNVVAAYHVTPRVRRIVLGGAGAAHLRAPADALGPYLKLHIDGPGGRSFVRTYSIRRSDPEKGEIHVDVILHEGGPGSDLARQVRPGDALRWSGPGWIPAEPYNRYLLVGDHTALPAIAQILESLPEAASVRAIVEVPDLSEEQPLPFRARAAVTWLHRTPGRASGLPEACRAACPEPGEPALVWAGAESAIARAIRHEARRTWNLPAPRCQVLNYWKAGRPEGAFSYVD